jgi:hypothetical protein
MFDIFSDALYYSVTDRITYSPMSYVIIACVASDSAGGLLQYHAKRDSILSFHFVQLRAGLYNYFPSNSTNARPELAYSKFTCREPVERSNGHPFHFVFAFACCVRPAPFTG